MYTICTFTITFRPTDGGVQYSCEELRAGVIIVERLGLCMERRYAIPVEICIVSDSRLFYEGVAEMLGNRMSLQILTRYRHALMDNSQLTEPLEHVVLVDARIGHKTACSWIKRYKFLHPSTIVIIVDMENDVNVMLTYLAEGVDGVTLRDSHATSVASMISAILNQLLPLTVDETTPASHDMLGINPETSPGLSSPLTPREMEILYFIALDYSNQQIADALVIELPTVKNHVHNILDKLQLHHRKDAVHHAIQQGWLNAADSSSPLPLK